MKPISECIHIAFSGLIVTSLLQVVNTLAASCKLHAGLMQVKLFHQVAASLQISSCSKSDVHRLGTMCSQLGKIKSVALLAV
jgi:hypothetical protein